MAVKRWNGTSWDTYSANPNLNNTLSQWKKTAAGGETTLSGNDDSSINLAYTVGQESVYINGVLQVRGSDYTATNGSSIVLVNQLVAGNIVQVISPLLLPMSSVIPLSTIAAKGDIMIGTASSVPARLPIGANDQVLVADSTSSNGMAWKSYVGQNVAGKNFLINGGMEIDQRNTASSAVTINNALKYTVDRWFMYNPSATNITAQRVSGSNLGTPFAIQINGATNFNGGNFAQRVESFHIAPLANQKVTFSIKVFSTVSISNAQLYGISCSTSRDTVYDTNFFTQGVSIIPGLNNLSVTVTVPASIVNGGEFGFATGTIPSGQYVQISSAQVELGSVATSFSRAGETIQSELAACQRYYFRPQNRDSYANYAVGSARSTTVGDFLMVLPVSMRTRPTSVEYSGIQITFPGIEGQNVTGMNIDIQSSNQYIELQATVASGLTQFRMYHLGNNNNANAYIGISAEL